MKKFSDEFNDFFGIEKNEAWNNRENWKDEWKEMPEFVQKDLRPFRSLIVHFENEENLNQFLKLIDCEITTKTKFIWFPENEEKPKMKYIDEFFKEN